MSNFDIKNLFSPRGIDKTILTLEIIQNRLPLVQNEFRKKSLDYLEIRAKYHINTTTGGSSWYELTHTLENSFHKDYKLGTLINDCYYSAFVEYGTGLVGEGTHPNPQNYQYNVNGHKNAWYFYHDGTLHFTRGMEAHRFMYNAIQDYVDGGEYKRIFDEAFKKVMKGVL